VFDGGIGMKELGVSITISHPFTTLFPVDSLLFQQKKQFVFQGFPEAPFNNYRISEFFQKVEES